MPKRPKEPEFGPARDPARDPKLAAIFRTVADNSGWPYVFFYDELLPCMELMREVPGSFINESVEADCPVKHPPSIAALELVPRLVKAGHEGKTLVFGYGRDWYAMGDDISAARQELMRNYRFQTPHYHWLRLSSEFTRTGAAREFYEWRTAQVGRDHGRLVENSMSHWFSVLRLCR